ncbi:Gfo/Idh/MocA family oxidoreductase [Paenibacillus profundus]|uniref:Gfo/Idh/MocA family oxidoreductase n=1 Tax=Paenibacillus profundus TaxID=1173085 RepID=A0ABS8YKR0_9BACL|nr:Gfo/Idh/MocA family oxidoreductase [Paenibacillus profundus]MCE5171160.1 Gfo/Idh/MocA family oxidoreductase [Paenibacillus profundus]
MKALLVGFGSAGFHWYKKLSERGMLAAIVETDITMKRKLDGREIPFYTSLEEALQREQVDFLVNVTPPLVHTSINQAAFDRRLPVLCEKPISFDYTESVRIVQRAVKEEIPFMIAENYRCFPFMRKLKQLLDEGAIGEISSLHIDFYRKHQVERKYAVQILDDIGIHHFDLVRYLTGREGARIYAEIYHPVAGWGSAEEMINAHALLEMEGGIRVSYNATVASCCKPTPWSGSWRIEGTSGSLQLIDDIILLTQDERTTVIEDFSGVHAPNCLDEFVASLYAGREGETSGKEYIKTQAIVHHAHLSNATRTSIHIQLPDIL